MTLPGTKQDGGRFAPKGHFSIAKAVPEKRAQQCAADCQAVNWRGSMKMNGSEPTAIRPSGRTGQHSEGCTPNWRLPRTQSQVEQGGAAVVNDR